MSDFWCNILALPVGLVMLLGGAGGVLLLFWLLVKVTEWLSWIAAPLLDRMEESRLAELAARIIFWVLATLMCSLLVCLSFGLGKKLLGC